MIYRFQLGQDLYEHDNNKLVTIINRYPINKKEIPVYQVQYYDSGFKENKREYHLYENSEIYPDSKFRVGEIVYYLSQKRPYKYTKYIIIEVYFDDYSKSILYRCLDDSKNEKLFHAHQIYCYPFSHLHR